MHRPLRTLLCASAAALAAASADAQQAPPSGGPVRQASASGVKPQRPAAQALQVDPRLEAVLQTWGERSGRVKKLSGNHKRFIYQNANGAERRSVGAFAFQSPDKGMLRILPDKTVKPDAKSVRKGPDGQPLRVLADDVEQWVCDGEQILQMEVGFDGKQYSRIEIPPRMRGENIIQGPLPFLFGVSAKTLKQRYRMKLGDKHTWQPGGQSGVVHVIAYPLRKVDAQTWQKADVLLDGRTFLPTAIRMMDGQDQWASETVYLFDPATLKVNERQWIWKADPFKPSLRGWTLIENHVADEDKLREMTPQR